MTPLVIFTAIAATLLAAPGVAHADQYRNGHWIFGSIEQEFLRFLNPNGSSRIGEPTSDELLAGASGEGRWQEFGYTNRIFWTAAVDPGRGRQVGGLILSKYLTPNIKYEKGVLGYPVTSEEQAVGGRYNNFQNGAITYQNGAIAAYATYGDIRTQWGASGWETGPYGFPSTDPYQCTEETNANGVYGNGKGQTFLNGNKYFTSGADSSFINPGSESVNTALKTLTYKGTTKYTNALNSTKLIWNARGLVQIQQSSDPNLADVTISDYNQPGGAVGFYDKASRTVQFNDAYLSATTYPNNMYSTLARQTNLVAHEFGHAMGMGHSCQTALMDPISSNVTQLNIVDKTAFSQMWSFP
ncbi:matrixin family metalloprotease [Rhodococcus sp. BH5]|uniref:matrixin family metalloprotease n=1 Tax=Rhodococcus sp. BH5 TaxID=2871702 RepID=UPI0022CD7D56|nr:matrixin family metalloprotease [Rhodococcus sp. BH5]MCZ9634608.1 matrixin family metalloprotease [Rhodococcus sp. BH5]